VTRSLPICAHDARTNALSIAGIVAEDARVTDTPGLRFRTIAEMMPLTWHGCKDTANAVRVNALPGFKSPILRIARSSPARMRFPGQAVALSTSAAAASALAIEAATEREARP